MAVVNTFFLTSRKKYAILHDVMRGTIIKSMSKARKTTKNKTAKSLSMDPGVVARAEKEADRRDLSLSRLTEYALEYWLAKYEGTMDGPGRLE